MSERSKHIIVSLLFFSLLVGVIFLLDFALTRGGEKTAREAAEAAARPNRENPFRNARVEARAAYVLDIKRRQALFAKNHETQLPLASVAKIMTALLAAETFGKGDIVTVDKDAVLAEGDTGLLVGERWSVGDLVDLTLITSSNDGAKALAGAVLLKTGGELLPPASRGADGGANETVRIDDAETDFRDLMNAKAREIGMQQTYFINESGLDVTGGVSGAYGSARDLALLVEYALRRHPDLLAGTRYEKETVTSLDGIRHATENTNDLVAYIPGITASKTGYTDLAGGNLAVVFEAGPVHPVVVVVLGSTRDGRFTDVETLIRASLEYLTYH